MSATPFDIFTTADFSPVADAFKGNFDDGGELGVQFCAFQNGSLIADLKGGWSDRRKEIAVTDNTLFSVYSSGKAMAALAIAYLVDQDKIGYDQQLTTFWPEFGQHSAKSAMLSVPVSA